MCCFTVFYHRFWNLVTCFWLLLIKLKWGGGAQCLHKARCPLWGVTIPYMLKIAVCPAPMRLLRSDQQYLRVALISRVYTQSHLSCNEFFHRSLKLPHNWQHTEVKLGHGLGMLFRTRESMLRIWKMEKERRKAGKLTSTVCIHIHTHTYTYTFAWS